MEQTIYTEYVKILHEELLPAMGCTEPIAVAYAAALAKDTLGVLPDSVEVSVSGNILKNVKSVIVPNTNGMKGIRAAAAAGITLGNSHKKLEVLSSICPDDIPKIFEYVSTTPICVKQSTSSCVFDIAITVQKDGHTAFVHIEREHTNVVRIEKDGDVLFTKEGDNSVSAEALPKNTCLSVEKIIEFADCVEIADVRDVIMRQVEYNTAIANEGLTNDYGARIGKILLNCFGKENLHNLAKATAAAGSDARMNGCTMPVVIVSGSGNQGMTASLPVIVYAERLGYSEEEMIRALVVSDLLTIHLKTGIGRLSAYCGAVSAGCGAGAGICYLLGGKYDAVAHTLVNALAINSGIICDGAKSSCAAKIASAVEAGLLGYEMYRSGSEFLGGDGIVVKGVENTIVNVGTLARVGMKETDEEIIRLMIKTV